MWAPALGIEEDAATGGACAALVGAMASKPDFGGTAYRLSIQQGVSMGRRSEIEAEARCGTVDACRKARGPLTPHHGGRRQGLRHEGLRQHSAGVERDAARYQERQRPHQQPGPQNHAPARLCHQPEPPMADRKGLRVAEANRPAATGQVTRPGESGLAVRLQLRGAQPDPAAATDGSTTGNAPGEVCLSNGCEPREWLLRPANPYKHWPEPYFKQISNRKKRKSPEETPQSGEFQRVPRGLHADKD